MIFGAPGTGKTRVINSLLKILAFFKKKVLLVSQTNNAVDNVFIKL